MGSRLDVRGSGLNWSFDQECAHGEHTGKYVCIETFPRGRGHYTV